MKHKPFIFTLMCLGFFYAAGAQYIADPYDGPVSFIKQFDTRHRTEDGNDMKYTVSNGFVVNPGDRMYMRMSAEDGPCRLILTKFLPVKNYLYVTDSIEEYKIIKWYNFSKSDTVLVWGAVDEYEGDFSSDKPDPFENNGLYVMHYIKSKDNYDINWALNKKINYLLNSFYADAAFVVSKKIDSSKFEDYYSINYQLKPGYIGTATIASGLSSWSCYRMIWYSLDMEKAAIETELANWKKEFATIKNAKFSDGGLAYGLHALTYTIQVDQALCKYPGTPICEGAISRAPGRILIHITPIKTKQSYMLEFKVEAW